MSLSDAPDSRAWHASGRPPESSRLHPRIPPQLRLGLLNLQMTTLERAQVLRLLCNRREAITAAWEQAVVRTGYVPLTDIQVRERLKGWVDQLTDLLCTDPLELQGVQAVGSALARLYYGHAETLKRTLAVLGRELTTGLRAEEIAAVHPALVELLAELGAGFLAETRQIVLAEQETIHHALLAARQQVEEALRESEARFRAIFESAAIGIGIGGVDGRILETNRALQELLGYSANELRQRIVAEFMHPDDVQSAWEAYQQLVTGQRDHFQLEKPFFRKDGQSVWTHLTVSLVRDAEGHPQLQIAMIENVTERKQAEETVKQLNADLEGRVRERTAQLSALNETLADEIARRSAVEAERVQLLARAQAAQADAEAAQQRLAFLAEASGALASSLDYKTTLASVARVVVPRLADWCAVDVVDNAEAIHRLGVAHVDLSKTEAVRALEGHAPHQPDALSGIAPVLETGRSEYLERTPNNVLPTEAGPPNLQALYEQLQPRSRITVPLITRERIIGAITLVRAESGRSYTRDDLALAEDLARRAAFAIQSAGLYQEAQEALATRDEFLSVAAHELKTPITSLRGFAQLTLRALDQPEELDRERLQKALGVVDTQSHRLVVLVTQLLDVSRIQSGRLALNYREVDLRQLVSDVVATAQTRSEQHDIRVHVPAAMAVRADPLRVEQVLVNLLDNAIKFSPAGGAIDVEVTSAEPEAVRLAVRDYGIGIAPEHRGHIFERFYQAGATVQHSVGMGLGLFISRQIIELHGGRITAEFPEDGGTRFVVILPSHSSG